MTLEQPSYVSQTDIQKNAERPMSQSEHPVTHPPATNDFTSQTTYRTTLLRPRKRRPPCGAKGALLCSGSTHGSHSPQHASPPCLCCIEKSQTPGFCLSPTRKQPPTAHRKSVALAGEKYYYSYVASSAALRKRALTVAHVETVSRAF